MGYYTRFKLEVDRSRSDRVELDRYNEDVEKEKTFGSYDLPLDLFDSEPMKWYDWPDDMKKLSVDYPNVLFVLSGEGEESGDIWRAYFMNGEMQEVKARIVFDDVDLDKFKKVDLTAKRRAEREAERARLERELERVRAELDTLA